MALWAKGCKPAKAQKCREPSLGPGGVCAGSPCPAPLAYLAKATQHCIHSQAGAPPCPPCIKGLGRGVTLQPLQGHVFVVHHTFMFRQIANLDSLFLKFKSGGPGFSVVPLRDPVVSASAFTPSHRHS